MNFDKLNLTKDLNFYKTLELRNNKYKSKINTRCNWWVKTNLIEGF